MGVQGKMRDRMEKFVVLPFSMGCVSQASVDVVEQRPRRSLRIPEEEDDDESLSNESLKHSSRFLALPRPNLSTGVNKLVKGFKSLSQLFIYEDEMDELGMEMDMDMEIGCPTDVKHVTHIGWDNIAKKDSLIEWDNVITSELMSYNQPTNTSSGVNLKHFQLAGATPESDPATFITSLNAY